MKPYATWSTDANRSYALTCHCCGGCIPPGEPHRSLDGSHFVHERCVRRGDWIRFGVALGESMRANSAPETVRCPVCGERGAWLNDVAHRTGPGGDLSCSFKVTCNCGASTEMKVTMGNWLTHGPDRPASGLVRALLMNAKLREFAELDAERIGSTRLRDTTDYVGPGEPKVRTYEPEPEGSEDL